MKGTLGPGEVLAGRFRLLELIGKGVLASVWRARDDEGNRLVAVKVLKASYAERDACRRSFLYSARQMAKFRHPGIVRVLEAHGYDEHCFFVMELVDGQNLRCSQARKLSRRDKLSIVVEVGGALSYAHRKGVVHRCLKPTNVLLSKDGRALVTDFDLARAVDVEHDSMAIRVEDCVYVAPEVSRAAEAGIPADVYSLGMIALFLWHDAELRKGNLNGHEAADFAWRLPICEAAREAVARAVDLEPGNRWRSVLPFCDELNAAFNGKSWNTRSERSRMCNWLRPKLLREVGRRQPHWTAEQREDFVAKVLRLVERELVRWSGERPSADELWSSACRVMKREMPSPLLDLGHRLEPCLKRLDDPERLVVTLDLLGTGVEEGARILGWTVRETKERLERGRRQLDECLESESEDEPPEDTDEKPPETEDGGE